MWQMLPSLTNLRWFLGLANLAHSHVSLCNSNFLRVIKTKIPCYFSLLNQYQLESFRLKKLSLLSTDMTVEKKNSAMNQTQLVDSSGTNHRNPGHRVCFLGPERVQTHPKRRSPKKKNDWNFGWKTRHGKEEEFYMSENEIWEPAIEEEDGWQHRES